MSTPILLEVVENELRPRVIEKAFPNNSPESLLLVSGYQATPQELLNFQLSDKDAHILRLALLFCNPVSDVELCRSFIVDYCKAYDELKTLVRPQQVPSVHLGFIDILEVLGSTYEDFSNFFKLIDVVKSVKNSGVDISALLDSMYIRYSCTAMRYIEEIYQDLNQFEKLEELIFAEIKAKEIGLTNENTVARVADIGLEFVENQIGYINYAAQQSPLNPNTQQSQNILGLINKLGEISEPYKQRFELFRDLIGISEQRLEMIQKSGEEEIKEIELDPVNFKQDNPVFQSEASNNLYSYSHIDFYVEVKRGRQNNRDIVIKRYKALDNVPWNPEKFTKELQILQKCSELAGSGGPFLKCFNIHMQNKCITIVLESVETDLGKRIDEYKQRRQNFTEDEQKIIADKLVRGFTSLQQIGIKHQDIKPQNILVNGSGPNIDVKIIDFSVSEFKYNNMATTQTAQTMTTAMYRAPEIAGKQGMVSFNAFKADSFSLGLVLMQLYDVNYDIADMNQLKNIDKLLNDVNKVRFLWLKNLLLKMLVRSENRLTFRELVQFLPGLVTGAN